MGYVVLDKQELNYQKSGLELVRYAVLDNDGQLYVQLKIKNIDEVAIESFTLVYKVYGETFKKDVEFKSTPGQEFYEKNLIPIDDEDFKFVTFKNVVKEEKEEDEEEEIKQVQKRSSYYDEYEDEDEFERRPRKQTKQNVKVVYKEPVKMDKFPIILWIVSLLIFFISIFICTQF